ncbi:hypothetical protein [Tomitella gaofuii]|nr:hypothetical protein [Tomitella gaofuii]
MVQRRGDAMTAEGRLVLAHAQIALLLDDLSRTRGHWSDLRQFLHALAA